MWTVAEMPSQLGPAKGKDFDHANCMGPCIVTADELDVRAGLRMEARVNGEVWGGGSSASMHHTFEDCIAHDMDDRPTPVSHHPLFFRAHSHSFANSHPPTTRIARHRRSVSASKSKKISDTP